MLVIVANKSVPTLIKHNDIENMNSLAIHSDIDSITIYISYSFSFIESLGIDVGVDSLSARKKEKNRAIKPRNHAINHGSLHHIFAEPDTRHPVFNGV